MSPTRSLYAGRKPEGQSGIYDQSFPTSPEERTFRSSLALQDLREPVGGIQSPGRWAGNSAKQPFPFPRPRRRAPAASDWGWTRVSHDPGRGNSAVYWLPLETSPRGAPSCTSGLVDGPNPSRSGSRLRPRTEVLIVRGRVIAKLGGTREPTGSGCIGRPHSAFLRF